MNEKQKRSFSNTQLGEALTFKKLSKFETILVVSAMLFALIYGGIKTISGTEITVAILQTADTNGFVYPMDYEKNERSEGSLAQLCSVIKAQNELIPETLLIDCGNFSKGNRIEFFSQDTPSPASAVMSYLEYDAICPSAYELEDGAENVGKLLSELDACLLSANIYNDGTRAFTAYSIFEVRGIRIAVIGLNTAGASPADYSLSAAVAECGKVLDELSGKAELIICAVSSLDGSDALTEVQELADSFGDSIDAILIGGNGKELGTVINGVPVLSPGEDAKYISRLMFTFKQKGKTLELMPDKTRADLLTCIGIDPDKDFLLQFARHDQRCLDYK